MKKSSDIDRGWAYVVLAGFFFNRFLTIGLSLSPGILYNDMLDYFETSPALTAWAVNLNSFAMHLSGSISSAFIKTYGPRVTVVIGCIISTAGLLATSFATSLVHIFVFYGLMGGFGFSMINVSCFPVITSYFVKYRGAALLLTSSGIGAGQFVLPYLFFWLSNAYSWKGAVFVIAGLNLNFLVVAAVFMPPRIESEAIEFDDTPQPSNKAQNLSITNNQLMITRAIFCLKTSLVDDLILFRDYCFVLIFLRYLFCSSSNTGTLTQIKNYGLQEGLSDFEATNLLSFLGLFSLIGTVTITLLLRMPRMNILVLNLIFTIGVAGSIIILGVVSTRIGFFIVVSIFGFFLGSIASFPLVIMTVVGARNIAAGVGYINISIAFGCLAGGPIGGALYTADPTYIACFTTLGVFNIFGALLEVPIILARTRA